MKVIDIIGRKYGLLTILSYYGPKITGGKRRRCYLAKCDCGKEKVVLGCSVCKGLCKSCGCLRKRIGSKNPKWTGCGEISGNDWDYIRSRCSRSWGGKKRKEVIPLEITIKYAWKLFVKQEEKCALTGLGICFGKQKTASLDRIDSKKGYIKGNVQWVHKTINLMKQSLTQATFIEFCRLVAQCQANT